MNSCKIIHLKRETTEQPWGFRLQGGSDYSIPLSIQLINPNTPAHVNGLDVGDQVISINSRNVIDVTHQEAKMEITRSGNELELTVIKKTANQQSIATPQSLSKIKTSSIQKIPTSEFQIKSTNWQSNDYGKEISEHLRPKVSNFESSPMYNRDPLQREIWRPKAYRDNPQASPRHVGTAVYHAQYNSPIGLYSDDKVLEAFKSQTKHLIDEIKGSDSSDLSINNIYNQSSPTYQAVMNSEQQKHIPYSSEAKLSRTFRALEEDLYSVQGTSRPPKSIFDQRRQQQ